MLSTRPFLAQGRGASSSPFASRTYKNPVLFHLARLWIPFRAVRLKLELLTSDETVI